MKGEHVVGFMKVSRDQKAGKTVAKYRTMDSPDWTDSKIDYGYKQPIQKVTDTMEGKRL